jgi:branched-chain amino acid transport system substrate-binding protein
MFKVIGAALAASLTIATQAFAADVPGEIKIGTLYASSGRFASISIVGRAEERRWRRLCEGL